MAHAHVWLDFGQVRTKTIFITYLTQRWNSVTLGATTDSVVIGVASLRPEQIVGSSFFGRTFFLGAPLNRLTSARITVVRRRNMAQPDNQPACDRRGCTLTSGSQVLAHPELKRSR